jgi:hypothetical protein
MALADVEKPINAATKIILKYLFIRFIGFMSKYLSYIFSFLGHLKLLFHNICKDKQTYSLSQKYIKN